MEYIEAKNVRFSNIFESTELVHFKYDGDVSIPDDGILIIKDLGDELLDDLDILVEEPSYSPYLVLTGVKGTNHAKVAYDGEIFFLDYKPNKNEIIKELV